MKIYGQPQCSGCDTAKTVLDAANISYEYIDITKDLEAMHLLRSIGARQVPQIWKDNEHLGGLTELQQYIKAIHD